MYGLQVYVLPILHNFYHFKMHSNMNRKDYYGIRQITLSGKIVLYRYLQLDYLEFLIIQHIGIQLESNS